MLLVSENPPKLSPHGAYIIDDCPEDEIDFCSAFSDPCFEKLDLGLIAYEAFSIFAPDYNQAPPLLGYKTTFYGDVIFSPSGSGLDEEDYTLRNLCAILNLPFDSLPRFTLRDVGNISNK